MSAIALSTKLGPSLVRGEGPEGLYDVAPSVLGMILVATDTPIGFAWASGAASINVAASHNFSATNALTADSTLTLTGGLDGHNGLILVQQDGTGNRLLAFVIAGRTVRRDLNVPDTNPYSVPNALTMYQYLFCTIVGVPTVVLNKVYLQ